MSKVSVIKLFIFLFIVTIILQGCKNKMEIEKRVITGAERTEQYLPILKGKNVAVLANQTSMIGRTHLVDSLLSLKINIITIFTPEHGLRGINDAGELTGDYIDKTSGVKVISLYGKKFKPEKDDLAGVDIVVFDLQDAGARFYTYISTMHYIMEACAGNSIDFVVFDRPNPNGYFVDGPMLNPDYSSFVGMHPIPIVHGMTIGEYALMINGEGWLNDGLKCSVEVIKCRNYNHTTIYNIPVKPSPNLPDNTSILLYPGLCLFEGTVMSIGRGTDFPFKVIGHPGFSDKSFSFRPRSIPGASKYPRLEGEDCYGYDLREISHKDIYEKGELNLGYLLAMYNDLNIGEDFFTNYFNKLAGSDMLKNQIVNGVTEEDIRRSWKNDLIVYKNMRKRYLLYKDFE